MNKVDLSIIFGRVFSFASIALAAGDTSGQIDSVLAVFGIPPGYGKKAVVILGFVVFVGTVVYGTKKNPTPTSPALVLDQTTGRYVPIATVAAPGDLPKAAS